MAGHYFIFTLSSGPTGLAPNNLPLTAKLYMLERKNGPNPYVYFDAIQSM